MLTPVHPRAEREMRSRFCVAAGKYPITSVSAMANVLLSSFHLKQIAFLCVATLLETRAMKKKKTLLGRCEKYIVHGFLLNDPKT